MKKIFILGIIFTTFCITACGSLVSVKGPSYNEECQAGETSDQATTAEVEVWPFVEVQGPSFNTCNDGAPAQKAMADADETPAVVIADEDEMEDSSAGSE